MFEHVLLIEVPQYNSSILRYKIGGPHKIGPSHGITGLGTIGRSGTSG